LGVGDDGYLADLHAAQRWGFDDFFYGDVDGDGILDRLPANTAAPNYLKVSAPPALYLSWSLFADDATTAWTLKPRGRATVSATISSLLLTTPLITGVLAVVIFLWY